MPDSILAKAANSQQTTNILDSRDQKFGGLESTLSGMSTPSGDIDMKKIGQARNTLMDMKLTQVFFSVCA